MSTYCHSCREGKEGLKTVNKLHSYCFLDDKEHLVLFSSSQRGIQRNVFQIRIWISHVFHNDFSIFDPDY